MASIQERKIQAAKRGLEHKTIAFAGPFGKDLKVWNCAGESTTLDFRLAQLSMIEPHKRLYPHIDDWGNHLEWGVIFYNPFSLCEVCKLYHHKMTHEDHLNRIIF